MSESRAKSQAAEIFLNAAKYIRRYGWQEKGMGEHGKARCSMGALASAHPEDKWEKSVAILMYDVLYKELDGITLTQFNRKVRRGDKVADLFEKVALNLAK